jgi:peptidylprolyl isomerase
VLLVRFLSGIYETGEEIEFASDSGGPIGFLLGSGDWSWGWEAGMPGMRVGGRRELIFPTTPAFTPPGSKLGDTLVYVVDLLGVTKPRN